MGQNNGRTSADQTFTDFELTQRMRVFDNFPAVLRVALASSGYDWSVRQCHLMLHGGSVALGVKGQTAEEIAALIGRNDAKRMKT